MSSDPVYHYYGVPSTTASSNVNDWVTTTGTTTDTSWNITAIDAMDDYCIAKANSARRTIVLNINIRAAETMSGWVGQVLIGDYIVWESEPTDDPTDKGKEAREQAIAHAQGRLSELFSVHA